MARLASVPGVGGVVVEGLVLGQCVQEVGLVPDQGAVQQLTPAAMYPALHEGVHPRYLDAGGDDRQSGVGQQSVEGGGELRVAIADQEPGRVAYVLEVLRRLR